MKVGYISDLHIDFNESHDLFTPLVNEYNKNGLELLLIGGDTSSSVKKSKKFMSDLINSGVNAYIIFGNHEFYELERSVKEDHDSIDSFPLLVGCSGVIADTGWYDYTWLTQGSLWASKRGKTPFSSRTWPDHRFINWGDRDQEWFVDYVMQNMERQNKELDDISVCNKIVMTHMVPHYWLLEKDPMYFSTNVFFGGEHLSEFISRVKPKYCLFGHTHFVRDEIKDGVHYVSRPVGYCSYEWGNDSAQDRVERMLYVFEV